MKKIVLTLVFASAMTTLSAQTETKKTTENDYNKWSIELAGGVNKTQRPMTAGYSTSTPSPVFSNTFRLVYKNSVIQSTISSSIFCISSDVVS